VIRRWRIIEAAERAGDAVSEDWPGWAEVAVQLGYSDQAHLSRDVRRHLALTPQQYRRRASSGRASSTPSPAASAQRPG
jgi:AraC-like DNA-binding protein